MVTDLRKKDHVDYIVRVDGGKRLVTREELWRGATYKEFLETETGQAGLRQSGAGGGQQVGREALRRESSGRAP